MAESESGADKSEEPTEKRLRESREQGQLARARARRTVAARVGGPGGARPFCGPGLRALGGGGAWRV